MTNANDQASQFSRYFTVAEANAMLPLVRAIVQDLATTSQQVIERRERLSTIRGRGAAKRDDVYSEEVSQIAEELEQDADELQSYVDELRELGVETKGPLDGLVDFPARLDGRTVLLCWKLGEERVTHWHELDAGFAGRQEIDHQTCESIDGSLEPANTSAADD